MRFTNPIEALKYILACGNHAGSFEVVRLKDALAKETLQEVLKQQIHDADKAMLSALMEAVTVRPDIYSLEVYEVIVGDMIGLGDYVVFSTKTATLFAFC